MEQYIKKSALVAEIDEKIEYLSPYLGACAGQVAAEAANKIAAYATVKEIMDSLEVKEVDLETSIDDYINSHFTEGCDGGMISDWYKVLGGVHYKDLKEIAKHFFGLGINAQKGE